MTFNIHISDNTQPMHAELFVQLCELANMGGASAPVQDTPKRSYAPRGTETQAERYSRIRTELATELGHDVIPPKATSAEMQARTRCAPDTDWKDARARYYALQAVDYVLGDSDIVRVSDDDDDVQDDETPLRTRLREIAENDE